MKLQSNLKRLERKRKTPQLLFKEFFTVKPKEWSIKEPHDWLDFIKMEILCSLRNSGRAKVRMWGRTYGPSTQKAEEGGLKSEASLGRIVRASQKERENRLWEDEKRSHRSKFLKLSRKVEWFIFSCQFDIT